MSSTSYDVITPCALFTLVLFLSLHDVGISCASSQFSSQTPDGNYGRRVINGTCIHEEVRRNLQFTIQIKYPEHTLLAHKGHLLYIRGNAFGLNWYKGSRLDKTTNDTWRLNFVYQSASDGFRCQDCPDNTNFTGGVFEFRVYVDDKVDMLGGNFQLEIPVAQTSYYLNDTLVFHVYPWFFSEEGNIDFLSVQSPEVGNIRKILIYKPPSFHENPYKTYPTMLVFDLNEEIYNVSVDIINKPIVEGTVGECILIGFGDYTKEERSSLLAPFDSPGQYFLCTNGSREDGCGKCIPEHPGSFINYLSYMGSKCGRHEVLPGKGNDTIDFLIRTVLPKAKRFTDNRMLTDQANFGIWGFSLGGLLACHSAWTMPHVFGMAACQSPAFFWPLINSTNSAFSFINYTMKDQDLRPNRPYQKIYLDAGGTETYSPSVLMPAILETATEISNSGSFELNKNLWVNIFPTGTHTFKSWLSRLWAPLRVFFPMKPASTRQDIGPVPCATSASSDSLQ